MNYATVCSGIGAPEQAFSVLPWRCLFAAEIEAFPSAVHATRFPGVSNLGDITKFKDWPDYAINLLVGGTPCQSFSVAGLRKGLDDPRGNLALTFLAIVNRYAPRWVLWENVFGVLSSSEGRDFGAFLGGLGKLGYGFAYRVLDAQFFGVPQRRRRVFVVGHSGGLWQRAAAVLFDAESLRGNPPPSREKGQRVAPTTEGRAGRSGSNNFNTSGGLVSNSDIAPTISARTKGGGGLGTDFDCNGGLIARETAHAPCGHMVKGGDPTTDNYVAHSLRADGFDASEYGTGRGTPVVTTLAIRGRGDSCDLETRDDGTANAILTPNGGRGGIGVGAVAIPIQEIGKRQSGTPANGVGHGKDGDPMFTLQGTAVHGVAFQSKASSSQSMNPSGVSPAMDVGKSDGLAVSVPGMAVRRLTPRECERLQGFPDDFTLIEYRGKPAADGPRYKALGNSMAVPVVRWIGRRIQMLEQVVPLKPFDTTQTVK